MNIQRKLSALTLTLAVAAALPMALLPGNALAQTRSTQAGASIASFGVEPAEQLRPGEVLPFVLNATPGATATLKIDGSPYGVRMEEVRPGVYEGSYTIRQSDRMNASSRVTAQVIKNGQSASATLSRSLLAGAPDPAPLGGQITAFNVESPDRVRPGDELNFSLTGTPGGQARVMLGGINRPVALQETSRGVYEGNYVVRRDDKLRGPLEASAYLMNDGRETSQRYERALAGQGWQQQSVGADSSSRDNRVREASCAACGSVVSVNVVEVKGDSPNVLGTIAGGVIGGVVGNQVGGGSGQDIARVLGAVGGAYAGNRVQNNMNKTQVHRVTVRMEKGGTQRFDYANDPGMAVGTRVKVENGALTRR